MLPTTTTIVQIRVEVKPNGSPPIGTRTLRATATPPTIPPIWSTFERATTIHRRLIYPIRPNLGGTLL
ncbi:MAG: hypothetical protein M3N09_09615 [Actinomycetota bacterium]|nr:hypothetical protein [Actinomycetota bacterium]